MVPFNKNKSIWIIDGTQTGTTTLGQSEPGSNGNKEYSTLPRTVASPSDAV